MKYCQAAVLMLAAASGPVPGSSQLRMRTKTQPKRDEELQNRINDEEEVPFWTSALLNNLDSMVAPTPTQAPPAGASIHPSLGDTFLETGFPTPTPTIIPGSISETDSPSSTPKSINIVDIDNSSFFFSDILNVASYSTFCRAGEYTNVQIVSAREDVVYCITNFEGGEVEFGYEQDYPDRPIMKLDITPPLVCGDDEVEVEDSISIDTPYKNYCGFFGKANFQPMAITVTDIDGENIGFIDANITETASYTTYCVDEEYSNVEIVDINGDIYCVTVAPGNPTIEFVDNSGFMALIDVEPTMSCNGIDGSISVPCGFEGVALTVWPNFISSDSNITDSNSTVF